MAIMLPRARFILCDSIGKKIRAVEDMAAQLGLSHVRCVHGRAEDLPGAHGGEGVDVVLARGVTRLETLAEYARPLLDWRGPRLLLAWKGGDIAAEIAAARRISGVSRIDADLIRIPGESYFLEEEKQLVRVCFQ
jgi:16S rRNA (guanine527-N7)-methyltransferase